MNEKEIWYWAGEKEDATVAKTGAMNRARQFGITDPDYLKPYLEAERKAEHHLKELIDNSKYSKLRQPGVSDVTIGKMIRYTRKNEIIKDKKGKPKGLKLDSRMKDYKGLRSLWHDFGFHVKDGKAAKLRRGQKADFNPKARSAMLSWAASVWMRKTGIYGKYMEQVYNQSKQNPNHADWTEAHHKNHAKRLAIKELLADFYCNFK